MMYRTLSLLAYALAWGTLVYADEPGVCRSSGTDFVNGQGPYCIDTTTPGYFSFGTKFSGCTVNDTQGGVVPIVVDPTGEDYFCSTIQTNPDGVEMISTCDLPGEEVLKSSVTSGEWIVVIEGLTFAWMRTFQINAGPPVITTLTPTATFTITESPSTTVTTTTTDIDLTTLTPDTLTLPSSTYTRTVRTTPAWVTTTSTVTITRTRRYRTFGVTKVTTTVTTSCRTIPSVLDPTCTIRPAKAQLAAATIQPVKRGRMPADWRKKIAAEANLVKRSPDACTTTVVATETVSETTTTTAPTSTETVTTDTTISSTITPPPVTAYSGIARATITITAPTPTRTKITRSYTTITTTKSIIATITITAKTTPTGVICAPR